MVTILDHSEFTTCTGRRGEWDTFGKIEQQQQQKNIDMFTNSSFPFLYIWSTKYVGGFWTICYVSMRLKKKGKGRKVKCPKMPENRKTIQRRGKKQKRSRKMGNEDVAMEKRENKANY